MILENTSFLQSSVLSCLLGEIPDNSGQIGMSGTVSYASQEPWLFSGSVRDNILFGRTFNEESYWKVIEACGLSPDLLSWEKGDFTLVGERGIMLSGN